MNLDLTTWWIGLDLPEKIFWSIAIIFSVLFIIQYVLSLFGLDFIGDSDGADAESGFHLDADFAFISVRSIVAFFTFFGWTGVLVLGKGVSVFWAFVFALASGFAAMVLVAYLFYLFSKLTQSGSTDLYQALFSTGEVYIPIPGNKNGAGKIQILIHGSLREMDAMTEGEQIPTGTKVKVTEIINDSIFMVMPVDTFEISGRFGEPPSLK